MAQTWHILTQAVTYLIITIITSHQENTILKQIGCGWPCVYPLITPRWRKNVERTRRFEINATDRLPTFSRPLWVTIQYPARPNGIFLLLEIRGCIPWSCTSLVHSNGVHFTVILINAINPALIDETYVRLRLLLGAFNFVRMLSGELFITGEVSFICMFFQGVLGEVGPLSTMMPTSFLRLT